MKLVDDATREARLAKCADCKYRAMVPHCSLCGCPVEPKAAWRSSRCDAEFWPPVPDQ